MWFADCSCQLQHWKDTYIVESLNAISSWGRSQQVWLFPGEGYCDLQVPSTVSAVYWEIISHFTLCASTCITHTLAILSCMEYQLEQLVFLVIMCCQTSFFEDWVMLRCYATGRKMVGRETWMDTFKQSCCYVSISTPSLSIFQRQGILVA